MYNVQNKKEKKKEKKQNRSIPSYSNLDLILSLHSEKYKFHNAVN